MASEKRMKAEQMFEDGKTNMEVADALGITVAQADAWKDCPPSKSRQSIGHGTYTYKNPVLTTKQVEHFKRQVRKGQRITVPKKVYPFDNGKGVKEVPTKAIVTAKYPYIVDTTEGQYRWADVYALTQGVTFFEQTD